MGSFIGARTWRATWKNSCALLLLIIALGLLLKASWITVKALVAQQLIAHAWQQSLVSTRVTKAWAWADTWPVASLTTPAGDKLYVLAGASGEALAFGPGLLSSSAALSHQGAAIIAGHRDTHFAFMEQLNLGDRLQLQDIQAQQFSYQVTAMEVVDSYTESVMLQRQDGDLTLITCYPFHALNAGGPLRYLVHAQRIDKVVLASELSASELSASELLATTAFDRYP